MLDISFLVRSYKRNRFTFFSCSCCSPNSVHVLFTVVWNVVVVDMGNVSYIETSCCYVCTNKYIDATFFAPQEAAPVSFFTAWYRSQTDGAGLHSPEVCLPAGGWEIFSLRRHSVSMPGTVYGTFQVNRAVIEQGMSRQLVYYWFEQRGRRMTNDFAAKISVVHDSLRIGRTDGALVRFVTPIAIHETEADADARIARLMAEVLPQLPRFVPE